MALFSPTVLTAFSLLAGAQAASFVCSEGSSSSYTAAKNYVGCFEGGGGFFDGGKLYSIAMTPQVCSDYCGERGFVYGAIYSGTQCLCGSSMSDAPATSDDKCNTKCPTDPSLMCGSYRLYVEPYPDACWADFCLCVKRVCL
ncbi:hypothetical protein LZ30DRAFT_433189 [Colletotrichum cereale]|nr:hypothetical protein LZ30DRAFT_433189 [Colletotrichum cereale]